MTNLTREQQIAALEKDWAENPRWKLVKRGYSAADVVRLRGSMQPEYTLAKNGAEKLWDKVNGGAKKVPSSTASARSWRSSTSRTTRSAPPGCSRTGRSSGWRSACC